MASTPLASAPPPLAPGEEGPGEVHAPSGEGPIALRPPVGSEARVVLPWLVRLRWGAVSGQALTILVVSLLLDAPLPLVAMACLIAVAAATNLVLAVERGRTVVDRIVPARLLVPGVLTLDTLLLTGLLALSGGPKNPFAALYVLHVAMAAVISSTRWVVWTVVLSAACYGALFPLHLPLEIRGEQLPFNVYLVGSWVSVVLVAAVAGTFIERMTVALRRRDEQLGRARDVAERNERLASLTTLAAGAAHELGTPLGTIAVVARELEVAALRLPREVAGEPTTLPGEPGSRVAALVEDARLIRAEVDRCRRILDRMGAQAERASGSRPERVRASELLAGIRQELPPERRGAVRLEGEDQEVIVPSKDDLVQALHSLVTNALDATEGRGPVELAVERRDRLLVLSVRDSGHGMPPDVLAHAIEPFFTTKAPGHGTGLGLYLVRLLAERHGGRLHLESRSPGGTRATLELPEAELAEARR